MNNAEPGVAQHNPTSLWSKDFVYLLLVVVFASFTHNAFTFIIPVYVLDIGGDNAISGLMIMGLTASSIVTRLVFGPLIDRVGRKKILVLGGFMFMLNTALYCIADSIASVFVLRVVSGITQGIYYPVAPTMIADSTPQEKRIDAVGFYGVAGSLGMAVGPVLGEMLYENVGVDGLFIASAVMAFIAFIFALLVKDYYVPQACAKPEHGRKRARFKLSTVVELSVIVPSLVYFFAYFGNSSVTNFLAPYGISKGLAGISTFFVVSSASMIVARLLTGRLVARIGFAPSTMLGLAMQLVATTLVATVADIRAIYLAAVFFGAGFSIASQLLQVLVMELVPENRRGVSMSTFLLFGDVGLGLGASAWGAISSGMGYLPMFLLSAAVVAVSLVLYAVYVRRRKPQGEA